MLKFMTPWALLAASAVAAHADCGGDPVPCNVETGSYHVALPDGEIKGSIVFLHGFGGSGTGTLNNKVWVPVALERGYAVIAPDGMPREGRGGNSWSFHPHRVAKRDEAAFLMQVRDDAAARFDLDADKMLLGGFSIGGSMTSYVACAEPDAFHAYVPVAGSFWRPHPQECAGPVRVLHTHGWTDTTVPLEGRVVRGEDANDPDAFIQGDVFNAMNVWRGANQCLQIRADRFVTKGDFMRRSWLRCADDTALEFAIFAGGHRVPEGWAEMAFDWAEKLD